MSARPRAGSLSFDESGCLYETCFFCFWYRVEVCASFAVPALILWGWMPREIMGRNSFLWEITTTSCFTKRMKPVFGAELSNNLAHKGIYKQSITIYSK